MDVDHADVVPASMRSASTSPPHCPLLRRNEAVNAQSASTGCVPAQLE